MSNQNDQTAFDRVAQSSRIFAYLYRYRNLLRKHWWIPALTITIAMGAQGWRIWSTPPSFVSTGKMVMNMKINVQGIGGIYSEEINNFVGTQAGLMQSGNVLNRAADRVKALHPDWPVDQSVRLLVEVLPKTTIFKLTAVGTNADYEQAYLNAAMEEYINLKREMIENTSEHSLSGIRDRLAQLEKQLAKGEEDILNFQSSNSVVLLQEQGGGASKTLVLLDQQLRQRQSEYGLLSKMSLDQSLQMQENNNNNNNPAALGELPAIDLNATDTATNLAASGAGYIRLKQTLQLKKAEMQELSQYYRPKHPRIIALNEEIGREEKLLDILRTQSSEQLENRRASLKLEIENLQEQIKQLKDSAEDISRKMSEYQKIKDNYERNQKENAQLLATMQNLDVSRETDPESVVISEKACPALPNHPNLIRSLLVAGFVGLMLGAGVLFILDRMDDRPTSFTELQDMFDENILGQIPAEIPAAKGGELKLIQQDDRRHAFIESYRNLRSSLLYMATEGRRAKTMLITSAVPGDGKSMTAANIAITMALAGSSVLLVDADLRKGHLQKRFGLGSAETGFTEVLSQGADWTKVVIPTHIKNLTLLPRGGLSQNAGELFLKSSTHELLKEFASRYDYVLIDTAPVMAADDAGSLSPHVEGVMFVVRAGQTSARVAHAALDVLYQREVNVLGLVFNGVDTGATEYYFYKYKDYTAYPSS
jgi:polysaccharide biosynthesis transport protein